MQNITLSVHFVMDEPWLLYLSEIAIIRSTWYSLGAEIAISCYLLCIIIYFKYNNTLVVDIIL